MSVEDFLFIACVIAIPFGLIGWIVAAVQAHARDIEAGRRRTAQNLLEQARERTAHAHGLIAAAQDRRDRAEQQAWDERQRADSAEHRARSATSLLGYLNDLHAARPYAASALPDTPAPSTADDPAWADLVRRLESPATSEDS